jgi:hypothetical protein
MQTFSEISPGPTPSSTNFSMLSGRGGVSTPGITTTSASIRNLRSKRAIRRRSVVTCGTVSAIKTEYGNGKIIGLDKLVTGVGNVEHDQPESENAGHDRTGVVNSPQNLSSLPTEASKKTLKSKSLLEFPIATYRGIIKLKQ